MKVFISGGSGFVGSHSARKLAAAGHELRLLVLKGAGLAADISSDSAEHVHGSITDSASLKGKMEGCDIALNFVGIIIEVGEATFGRIHVQGMRNLLDEAKRAGVKRFIHISALGTSDKPASEYFRTKWDAEQLIKNSDIPYVILRPSLIFGPEDKFFNMLRPVLRLPVIPVAGTGKTRFQPVWVEDVASCVLKSVEETKPLNGVWEIAGPQQFTFDELLDQMTDILGVSRKPKLHVPMRVMMPLARAAEALFSKPPVTRDQLKMLSVDNVTPSNDIAETFGITPQPFREIVRQYWRD